MAAIENLLALLCIEQRFQPVVRVLLGHIRYCQEVRRKNIVSKYFFAKTDSTSTFLLLAMLLCFSSILTD